MVSQPEDDRSGPVGVVVGEPIELPTTEPAAPGSSSRRRHFSDLWDTEVVTNVTVPSLTPVLPEQGCGTAVVIAPGGAFHALSIESEGFGPARWLASRGVACFVLEYRLVPGGDDPVAEMADKAPERFVADVADVAPKAAADGAAAVRTVRQRAADHGVDPGRIGVLGFSAGGAVALHTVTADDPASRPDFTGALYAVYREEDRSPLPPGTGPVFAAAASDDPLGLADHAVAVHRSWREAGLAAELHLYASGGHGFGLRRQGSPSDTWIDRFWDWLGAQHLLGPEPAHDVAGPAPS